MENFDDYFKTLGEINHVERELKCCELKENFEYTNKGETICKICNNTISNIIDTPEWKNYKDSNTNKRNDRTCNEYIETPRSMPLFLVKEHKISHFKTNDYYATFKR